jgi:hypothetical protein
MIDAMLSLYYNYRFLPCTVLKIFTVLCYNIVYKNMQVKKERRMTDRKIYNTIEKKEPILMNYSREFKYVKIVKYIGCSAI